MAKRSSIVKNKQRETLVKRCDPRRKRLKAIVSNKATPIEERFDAVLKLAQMPRNGNPTRVRSRCEISGRPRAVYQKFKLSRIALRELGNMGLVTGLVKSSW
jgi:small subunit ribosomal protein S14